MNHEQQPDPAQRDEGVSRREELQALDEVLQDSQFLRDLRLEMSLSQSSPLDESRQARYLYVFPASWSHPECEAGTLSGEVRDAEGRPMRRMTSQEVQKLEAETAELSSL